MNKVQVSCLGEMGRFGNQLFQYAFAKSYADKYNCILEIPSDWIGWKIFELEDSVIKEKLPKTEIDEIPFGEPKDFYVSCHLRHGDFVYADEYCTISKECYVNECLRNGHNIEDIIIVSEENRQPTDSGRMNIEHNGENWNFLYDFFVLINSNVLYRSNSTFGWWAGVLGNHEKVYSPNVQGKKGQHMICVDFVEGNYPCHMEIDSIRHSDLYLMENIK